MPPGCSPPRAASTPSQSEDTARRAEFSRSARSLTTRPPAAAGCAPPPRGGGILAEARSASWQADRPEMAMFRDTLRRCGHPRAKRSGEAPVPARRARDQAARPTADRFRTVDSARGWAARCDRRPRTRMARRAHPRKRSMLRPRRERSETVGKLCGALPRSPRTFRDPRSRLTPSHTITSHDSLGFGIIGVGMIADFHAQAIAHSRRGGRLVGVATRNAENARAFAAEARGAVRHHERR